MTNAEIPGIKEELEFLKRLLWMSQLKILSKKALVREIFKISKVGKIAGCHITEGLVNKKAKVRLIRDNIVIRDALTIESLKHFKDDVREIKAGLECGIKLAKFDDVKVDDVLDFYEIVEVARTL